MTHAELATLMGISVERVKRLERQAMRKMRASGRLDTPEVRNTSVWIGENDGNGNRWVRAKEHAL